MFNSYLIFVIMLVVLIYNINFYIFRIISNMYFNMLWKKIAINKKLHFNKLF